MTEEQIYQFNQIQYSYPTSYSWLNLSLIVALFILIFSFLFLAFRDRLSSTDDDKFLILKKVASIVYKYEGYSLSNVFNVFLFAILYAVIIIVIGLILSVAGSIRNEAKVTLWEQNRAQFLLQLPREHYELVGDSPTPDGKISVLYKDKGTVYSSNIPTSSFLFDAKTEPYVSATWVPLQEGVPMHGIPEDLITSKDGKYGFWVNVELHYLGGDGESDAE